MANECPVCNTKFNKTQDTYTQKCRFCQGMQEYETDDLEEELNLLLNPSGKTQVKDYEKEE